MSLAVVFSRASLGIQAPLVEVEVHLSPGLPGFAMVGMPEAVVKESKERVRSAIINSHFEFPCRRITVNLAPAELPKEDGRYDLAIAIGILAASKQLPPECLAQFEFGGELGLAGELRPFAGMLPMILAARSAGRAVILPTLSANEQQYVPAATVLSAPHLLAVCRHLQGQQRLLHVAVTSQPVKETTEHEGKDLAEVCGQYQAKRALELAAAGGHSLLLCGPPGSGKSMLANRLPTLLPPLLSQAAIEVAAIYAMRGQREMASISANQRPFRAPHHSVSSVALIGGGHRARPGEVSLAHQGVLFLDELPEFSRPCLEGLREPLEERAVTISRAAYSIHYPARFQLIAAMNPCPCGYWQDGTERCHCSREQVRRYQARLSGPFLDRMDLVVSTQALELSHLIAHVPRRETSSADVRARVLAARARQLQRANTLNAELSPAQVARDCALIADEQVELQTALQRRGISARGYHRLLKVARTLADLEGIATIQARHWQEALMFKAMPWMV